MPFEFTEREDWRVAQMMQCGLDRPRLDLILGEIRTSLSWPTSAATKVAVLEPGLSGFQVLRVLCDDDGQRSIILKLRQYSTEADCNTAADGDETAAEKLLLSADRNVIAPLVSSRVVKYSSENISKEYWLCLVYPDVGDGRTTFKRFFAQRTRASDFEIADGKKCIEKLLDRYALMGLSRKRVTMVYSWSETPKGIKPLEQREYLAQYRQNMWAAFERRPDLAGVIEIDRAVICELLEFLENNLYRGRSIDSKASDVLVGDVHGDFNGGNILVSEANGEDAVFIDFGQIDRESPRHAMYDVGKLSIEFERFILPESAFDLNRPLMLKAWTDIHNCWAQMQPHESNRSIDEYNQPPFTVLFRLYSLLSSLRAFSLDMFTDAGIAPDLAHRHFHYVRLHHLLRIVNHPQIDTVRKLFAMRASLDIINILIREPRQCKTDSPQPPIFFDCTAEEFHHHLAMANSATIVGLTNEKLAEHLRKAWEKRGKKKWGDIRVIFLARHLLQHVKAPDGCTGNYESRKGHAERWNQAVEDVRRFFFGTGLKATHVEIRHSDEILPFVGQLYDDARVRVAFIHPKHDMRDNCYINFPPKSPCASMSPFVASRKLTDGPPCKTSQVDFAQCDKTCDWHAMHSPCAAIKNSFKCIYSSSTPLLAANVVGRLDQNDMFCYMCLIPQKDWQLFSFPKPMRGLPAHLQTFVLLRYKDDFLLLKRDETNSSDNRGKLSVISGKVNDEDSLDDQPDREHRTKVFDMQVADYDGCGGGEKQKKAFWTEHLAPLASSFGNQVGLTPAVPVQKELLKKVATKAGVRYAREKLLFDITATRLRHVEGSFLVHRPAKSCNNMECKDQECQEPSHGVAAEHVLYPIFFVLDIGELEEGSVSTSGIEILSATEFHQELKRTQTSKIDARFTEFLRQYGEAIVKWHYDNPWKNSLLGS